MTHGRVDVQSIVNRVLLAARDPRAYIKANAAACREYHIFEPTPDLHVVALVQHLPPRQLVAFDWKESMHEVLPMLERCLKAGPGEKLGVKKLEPRCASWDERPREEALKEISATLEKSALVGLNLDSDSYHVTAMTKEDAKHVATWKKRTSLPLKVIGRP